jgi:hypothetical protein
VCLVGYLKRHCRMFLTNRVFSRAVMYQLGGEFVSVFRRETCCYDGDKQIGRFKGVHHN